MNVSQLQLILSVWGSVLATILAVLKVVEQLGQSRRSLLVDGRVSDGFKSVLIRVTNIGRRPLTVDSITISYGSSPFSSQELVTTREFEPRKLTETDTVSLEVLRERLVREASERAITQKYRCLLWLIVTTSTGQRFERRIPVPHQIIEKDHFETARDWIAADLFLGFPQMESEVPLYPINILK